VYYIPLVLFEIPFGAQALAVSLIGILAQIYTLAVKNRTNLQNTRASTVLRDVAVIKDNSFEGHNVIYCTVCMAARSW
jgi:hypothetical protein